MANSAVKKSTEVYLEYLTIDYRQAKSNGGPKQQNLVDLAPPSFRWRSMAEIAGMAEGSGEDVRTLFVLTLHEEFRHLAQLPRPGSLDHCTDLAACGREFCGVAHNEDGDEIDCTKMGIGGKAIPSNIDKVTNFRSEAKFVLLVEKDAAFMRLAEDRFYNRFPCIIITAKGQPDVATRLFLSKLKRDLRIPVLALVDADPYGRGP